MVLGLLGFHSHWTDFRPNQSKFEKKLWPISFNTVTPHHGQAWKRSEFPVVGMIAYSTKFSEFAVILGVWQRRMDIHFVKQRQPICFSRLTFSKIIWFHMPQTDFDLRLPLVAQRCCGYRYCEIFEKRKIWFVFISNIIRFFYFSHSYEFKTFSNV